MKKKLELLHEFVLLKRKKDVFLSILLKTKPSRDIIYIQLQHALLLTIVFLFLLCDLIVTFVLENNSLFDNSGPIFM